MGGHSLHAMELIAKIKEKMNVEIPLHQLFKLATIKELSAFIEANHQEDKGDTLVTRAADPENIHEIFPLTGIQLAYLVGRDETFEIGGVATNLTVEFEADVDLNRFQLTLQKLIDRHPILRTIVFENGTQKNSRSNTTLYDRNSGFKRFHRRRNQRQNFRTAGEDDIKNH